MCQQRIQGPEVPLSGNPKTVGFIFRGGASGSGRGKRVGKVELEFAPVWQPQTNCFGGGGVKWVWEGSEGGERGLETGERVRGRGVRVG